MGHALLLAGSLPTTTWSPIPLHHPDGLGLQLCGLLILGKRIQLPQDWHLSWNPT